jgi:hypothetical protein
VNRRQVHPEGSVGDRRIACACEKFKRDLRLCPKGDVFGEITLLATLLEFWIFNPLPWKIQFESERPCEVVGVPGTARNRRHEIDTDLARSDLVVSQLPLEFTSGCRD